MHLRIGKINYANLYPIFYTLEKECDPSSFQFIEGVPSLLNTLLRDGMVDISPSSSIEFLKYPDKYNLIEGHSISSEGPVRSILLFSKYPMEELEDKKIIASSQSETSIALLKIILKRFYGITTEIGVSNVQLQNAFETYDAYLLIGDDALRANRSFRAKSQKSELTGTIEHYPGSIFVYDLGALWYDHTGLPCVFALWIARKECCEREAYLRFIELLDRSKDFAFNNLEMIAQSSPSRELIGIEDLVSYWEGISYDFFDEHKKGLDLFKKYLLEEGLL